MELNIVNIKNEPTRLFKIKNDLWKTPLHQQSIYDAVVAQQASLRQGTHKTKNRADTRGGGRKPHAQKGTGRARQGSIRSPQYRGGGTVFGPTPERNYKRQVNKKVHALAMKSILAEKLNSKSLIIVDKLNFKEPSTKQAVVLLKNLKVNNKRILIITDTDNEALLKSFNNIQKTLVLNSNNLSVLPLLNNDFIIASVAAINNIEKKYS